LALVADETVSCTSEQATAEKQTRATLTWQKDAFGSLRIIHSLLWSPFPEQLPKAGSNGIPY